MFDHLEVMTLDSHQMSYVMQKSPQDDMDGLASIPSKLSNLKTYRRSQTQKEVLLS